MRHIVIGAALLAVSSQLWAKPCEELGAEISAKLEAKGIRGYSLKLVRPAEVGTQTVVGSCDGGRSVIVYKKGSSL